ncbi:MAG TPA: VOC family protein [Thermoplasmata archaeon]|nr:VOC family protein [Thermoplasmata archaeon]
MPSRTIVHFEIPATDTERLSRFYTEVFGWKFTKAPVPEMDYWLISTGPQGESVGGGMYRKMGADDRPRNFVAVEKIDDAIRTFQVAGGRQVVPKMQVPGMGWSFIGADPEGNLIALWEPLTPMPERRPATRRTGPARRARPRRATGSRPGPKAANARRRRR